MLTIFLWSNAWFSCIDGVAGIMPIIVCPSCNSTNTHFCHDQGFVENTHFCRKMGFIATTRLLGFVWCRLLRKPLGFDSDFAQICGLKIGGWQHWLSPINKARCSYLNTGNYMTSIMSLELCSTPCFNKLVFQMVHVIASGKTKVTNGISTLVQTSATLLTKLMKMIPVEPIKNLSSLPRRDLVVALAWAPIVAMDVAVQVGIASLRSRGQLVCKPSACVNYFCCA